jgi:hypothetical protein
MNEELEEVFAEKIFRVFKAEGFCTDDGSKKIVIDEVASLLHKYFTQKQIRVYNV